MKNPYMNGYRFLIQLWKETLGHFFRLLYYNVLLKNKHDLDLHTCAHLYIWRMKF